LNNVGDRYLVEIRTNEPSSTALAVCWRGVRSASSRKAHPCNQITNVGEVVILLWGNSYSGPIPRLPNVLYWDTFIVVRESIRYAGHGGREEPNCGVEIYG